MPSPDFDAVLRLLQDKGVRFVVIGGIAMRLHGSAHITEDIDISYSRDRENLQVLAEALLSHHPRLRGVPANLPFVFDHQLLRNVANMTLETDLGELDLMAMPEGIDSFEGLWERAVPMDLGGYEVKVAALDDLIAMKQAADRPKDRVHLLELNALRKLLAEG